MSDNLSGFVLYRNGNEKSSKEDVIEKNVNRVIRNHHLLFRYTCRTDHYGSISAWLHNFIRHKKRVQRNLKLNWMKDCIIIDRIIDYIIVDMLDLIDYSIYNIYIYNL